VTFILFIILRIWCYFLVSFNYYCATVPPLNELKQGCICQISTRTVTDVDTQTSSAVGWQTVKIDPPPTADNLQMSHHFVNGFDSRTSCKHRVVLEPSQSIHLW